MKSLLITLAIITLLSTACKVTGTMAAIQPKAATINLPATGTLRLWNGITHPSFTVTLTNPNATQSCEVYKVKDNGTERWISPSLQAGKSLTITVPANGHLYFKNFNNNVLNIEYKVADQ